MNLNRAVDLLKKGEVVAFPTETVYGLGADAENPSAVRKVFEIKGRPADNPLIVHIASPEMVRRFTDDVTEDAEKLMKKFWPGPLTLVFPKKKNVLDIITGGLDTVALRWPEHPVSQQLISLAGPLVAPSANSSGKPSPTKPDHVREDFGDDFPVIEAGETEIGLESTVLDISRTPYRIYRPGAVSAGEIADTIGGKIDIAGGRKDTGDDGVRSPGTKYTHYAPEAAVRWMEPGDSGSEDTLYLLHSKQPVLSGGNIIRYHGDFQRLARELYDRFRQADHEGYRAVAVESFSSAEQDPIIPALKNRIEKAIH